MKIYRQGGNFDFDSFFKTDLPVVTTVVGCEQINKYIRQGEHYPVIKLLHFFVNEGSELSVYQNLQTLEVIQVYEGQPTPDEDEYHLILTGIVPIYHMKAGLMVQAYMVPTSVNEGDQVYIPKVIEDAQGLGYSINHTGGVKALFTGRDIIFTEAPNRIKVYKG